MTTLVVPHTQRSALVPAVTALMLGLLALGALFHVEAGAAVQVWIDSTAYGHCFLVLPMALYLAWDRRASLVGVPLQPMPAAALLALPGAAAWFLAERMGIMEGRQLAAMGIVEVLFLAVLGWRLCWALAAPLLYLFFLVPFGAFLTGPLQHFTAEFIEIGLNVLGIPHIITDYLIEIPQGTFYVAEACAGLRFLIAAVAFGVFYAFLNYRSPGRRVAFIAASIVVPILANGIRALGIVVMGHIIGSAEAAAADHLIYGWVFFSVVLLLLVLAGMPLREPPPEARAGAMTLPSAHPGRQPLLAAALVVLAVIAGPASVWALNRAATPVPLAAAPSFQTPAGCTATGADRTSSSAATQRFTCGRLTLAATLAVFSPRATSEALQAAQRTLTGELGAEEVEMSRLTAGQPEGLSWRLIETVKPAQATALAAWVDSRPAEGGLRGRLVQARNSIAGSDLASVMVAVSAAGGAAQVGPRDREQMRAALRGFIDAQTDLTNQVAAAARGG